MSGRCWTMHAKQRAAERYGLDMRDDDFRHVLAEIQSGRSPCLRLVDKIGRVHAVRFRGDILIVALAADKDVIVTLLPPDYFCKGSSLKRAQGPSNRQAEEQKNRERHEPGIPARAVETRVRI